MIPAVLPAFSQKRLCGFYWTEGLRGLGWAVDSVPTLKGGSSIGIPSPPAIWDPLDHSIVKTAELVPYGQAYTYDLLPSGVTGFYWANGILLGSTIPLPDG